MKNTTIIKNLNYNQFIMLLIYSFKRYELKSNTTKFNYGALIQLMDEYEEDNDYNNTYHLTKLAFVLKELIRIYTKKIKIETLTKMKRYVAKGIERRIIELILHYYEPYIIAQYMDNESKYCGEMLDDYKKYYAYKDARVLPWQKLQLDYILIATEKVHTKKRKVNTPLR